MMNLYDSNSSYLLRYAGSKLIEGSVKPSRTQVSASLGNHDGVEKVANGNYHSVKVQEDLCK